METARKAKMTYFILRSAGTGQRFSLGVNREEGEPQRLWVWCDQQPL